MSPTCKDIFKPSHSSNPPCRPSSQFLSLPPSSCPPGEDAPTCPGHLGKEGRRWGSSSWSSERQKEEGWRASSDVQLGIKFMVRCALGAQTGLKWKSHSHSSVAFRGRMGKGFLPSYFHLFPVTDTLVSSPSIFVTFLGAGENLVLDVVCPATCQAVMLFELEWCDFSDITWF